MFVCVMFVYQVFTVFVPVRTAFCIGAKRQFLFQSVLLSAPAHKARTGACFQVRKTLQNSVPEKHAIRMTESSTRRTTFFRLQMSYFEPLN